MPIVAETDSELAGDYPRELKNERSLAGNLGKTSSTIVKGLRSQAPGRSRSSFSRQFGLGGMPDNKRWTVCREKTRSTTGVPSSQRKWSISGLLNPGPGPTSLPHLHKQRAAEADNLQKQTDRLAHASWCLLRQWRRCVTYGIAKA